MSKYKVIGMLKSGLNKELNDATHGDGAAFYFSERERLNFLVTVNMRQLYWRDTLLDTSDGDNETYLYVMDGEGRVFAASSDEVTHHSSFLAGNPVAAAGAIKVHLGRLLEVYDQSGHYQPPREYANQFIKEMKSRRVDMLGVTTVFQGQRKSQLKKAIAPRERLYPGVIKQKRY